MTYGHSALHENWNCVKTFLLAQHEYFFWLHSSKWPWGEQLWSFALCIGNIWLVQTVDDFKHESHFHFINHLALCKIHVHTMKWTIRFNDPSTGLILVSPMQVSEVWQPQCPPALLLQPLDPGPVQLGLPASPLKSHKLQQHLQLDQHHLQFHQQH